MDGDDKIVRRKSLPLLLNFARPQPACDVDHRYDARLRLNLRLLDGVPVVAGDGRILLKTQAVIAEDKVVQRRAF